MEKLPSSVYPCRGSLQLSLLVMNACCHHTELDPHLPSPSFGPAAPFTSPLMRRLSTLCSCEGQLTFSTQNNRCLSAVVDMHLFTNLPINKSSHWPVKAPRRDNATIAYARDCIATAEASHFGANRPGLAVKASCMLDTSCLSDHL